MTARTSGQQVSEAGDVPQAGPGLPRHALATDLDGRGGCPVFAAWSTQPSDDALDADRCVQQYGLLACGRSKSRLGRVGWGSEGPSGGRGFELGSLLRGRGPLTTG